MAQTTFKRIAHPTDLAQQSQFAYYHALRLAVAAQAELDVLHVEKEIQTFGGNEFPSADQILTRWGLPPDALQRDGDRIRTIAPYGREPVHPILEYMDEALPDLMVLATHRRQGMDRWLHREIAQKLARSRAVNTLFVPFGDEGFVSPSKGTVELHNVLLPVDWLPAPQTAVDTAAEMVSVLGCEDVTFTLLHIAGDAGDFPAVRTPERQGWSWQRKTRDGDLVGEILAEADDRNADLIVMVTQGHDGFLDALRGSTTERVLGGARCPLLAVPALEPA